VRWLRRIAAPALQVSARTLISFMRSIHELIWAVLFLAAIGLSELAAVFAIAIPFAGVLAKVFSEVIDEVPRDGALALRGVGASGTQVFCFALLPAALPELIAYAFYRLECALRSAAVLGFFGFPTLGLHIRQSFSSTSYGEVWTFLYVLIALVMLFDVWSSAVRRRLLT
jgi:phosphonate transport system permease protein